MTEHRFTLDQQKDEREFRTGVERFLRDNGIHLDLRGNITTLAQMENIISDHAALYGKTVEVRRYAFDSAIVVRIGDPQPIAGATAGHAGPEPTPPPASETCPHAQIQDRKDGTAHCLYCGIEFFADETGTTWIRKSPETSTRPAMTTEVAEMAKESIPFVLKRRGCSDAEKAFQNIVDYALRMGPIERRSWIAEHTTEIETPFGKINLVTHPFLTKAAIQIQ